MNDIVKYQPATPATLPEKMQYAKALAESGMLPGQYRKQPANLLYALEYAESLGLHPMAAITGIHVIEGKPSASAALISALVRRAGHKLRVRGNDQEAVAQIIRADDPDWTFEARWTMARAEQAGLARKQVWKNYPAAMLKARAITEVARDACEEALSGMHYTPEELGANVDADGEVIEAEVQQLRRVQPGEGDPWTTAGPSGESAISPEQSYADAAGTTRDQAVVKEMYRQAHAAGLLAATVKVGDETQELGAYLIARGQQLAEPLQAADHDRPAGETRAAPLDPPSAQGDDGVTDVEVVAEGETEADIAERELRTAAAKAGLDNLDEEFERSYGLPIAQAGAQQLREMTALLTGTAA
jgi:hypothetical protein